MLNYRKSLMLLSTLALSSPTFADVHKWKDAEGNTHYGDAPPVTGTPQVKTDKQTKDQIENGRQISAATARFLAGEARENERREREREYARQAEERRQRDEALREEMRRRREDARR